MSPEKFEGNPNEELRNQPEPEVRTEPEVEILPPERESQQERESTLRRLKGEVQGAETQPNREHNAESNAVEGEYLGPETGERPSKRKPDRVIEMSERGYEIDPDHPNPFWREQEALLTPRERWTEGKIQSISRFFRNTKEKVVNGYRHARNALRPLWFRENPDAAKRTQDKYETMVKNRRAEFVGESSRVNYHDYILMKKAVKQGGFRTSEQFLVGVYDRKGNFTGRVRTYKIYK